jgi:hypothetical protein
VLPKRPEKICDQKNEQNGSKPDAGTAAYAVPAVTVETAAAAQNQNENDDQDQHGLRRCDVMRALGSGRDILSACFLENLLGPVDLF